MAAIVWPIIRYNDKGDFKCCDNANDVVKWAAHGYVLDRVKVLWPRTLYSETGETAIATDEDHLKELKKKGYGEDYVPLAAPSPKKSDAVPHGALDALVAENAALRKRLDALEEAVFEPKKSKARKPATDE